MRNELLCLGMSAVDLLVTGLKKSPGNIQDFLAEGMTLSPGGDALNQAAAAAKLGCSTGLITSVGSDFFGSYLTEHIQKHTGISRVSIHQAKVPTSLSIVLVEQDGERRFIKTLSGSVDEFSLEDIDMSMFTPHTKILSIGSLGGSRRLTGKNLACLLKKVKDMGILIAADMVDNLGTASRELLIDALPYIDYFLPSQAEAALFFGHSNMEKAAEEFLHLGVKHVAIKLGKHGVLLRDETVCAQLPPYQVKVVDTTGAGDHFVAGFLRALLKHMDFIDFARYGLAAAALSLETAGAGGTNVREQDIQKLIERNR